MGRKIVQQHPAVEKPKRPLTAYNLFFQDEREVLLAELPQTRTSKKGHGKIGFQDMARVISGRWKNVDPERLAYLNKIADANKARYKEEMKAYKRAQKRSNTEPVLLPPAPTTPSSKAVVYTQSDPIIASLAKALDKESIDFLITALR